MYWLANTIDSLVNLWPEFVIPAEHILNPSVNLQELIAYVPYNAFWRIYEFRYFLYSEKPDFCHLDYICAARNKDFTQVFCTG